MKLRNMINESSDKSKRMTEEEKQKTLDAVSRFNELGQNIYKTQEIKELVENLQGLFSQFYFITIKALISKT